MDHKADQPLHLVDDFIRRFSSPLPRYSGGEGQGEGASKRSPHPNPLPQAGEGIFGHSGQEGILFCAESAGRQNTLEELLRQINQTPQQVENWQAFLQSNEKLAITIAPLDAGLLADDPAIALITEAQLFGEQVMQRRLRSSARPTQS